MFTLAEPRHQNFENKKFNGILIHNSNVLTISNQISIIKQFIIVNRPLNEKVDKTIIK